MLPRNSRCAAAVKTAIVPGMTRTLAVPDRRAQRLAWLRRRFAQHNRLVALVAGLTLLVAAALWYLLFVALYWLALVITGAARGMDARPPDILPALFIYAAGLLLLVTWIAGTRYFDGPLKDKKSPLEIVAEFVLAVPRATLAVWGNLSAWQRLDPREMELAAGLLGRLLDEGRVPLHELPLDLPDPKTRMRILLALQLVEALHISRSDGIVWLSLPPKGELLARK